MMILFKVLKTKDYLSFLEVMVGNAHTKLLGSIVREDERFREYLQTIDYEKFIKLFESLSFLYNA